MKYNNRTRSGTWMMNSSQHTRVFPLRWRTRHGTIECWPKPVLLRKLKSGSPAILGYNYTGSSQGKWEGKWLMMGVGVIRVEVKRRLQLIWLKGNYRGVGSIACTILSRDPSSCLLTRQNLLWMGWNLRIWKQYIIHSAYMEFTDTWNSYSVYCRNVLQSS